MNDRKKVAGAGLPPAPTPETFAVYLMPQVWPITARLTEKIGDLISQESAQDAILEGSSSFIDEVVETLRRRGATYGEEVLLAMGEEGLLLMLLTKIMRVFWSHNEGLSFSSRRDGFVDLAGYAILALAIDQYAREWNASGAKDNNDRDEGL